MQGSVNAVPSYLRHLSIRGFWYPWEFRNPCLAGSEGRLFSSTLCSLRSAELPDPLGDEGLPGGKNSRVHLCSL